MFAIPLGGWERNAFYLYKHAYCVSSKVDCGMGLTGLFILWGLLHRLLSCFDRAFDKFEEKIFLPIRWICTFVSVSVLWLLFSAQSVEQWTTILLKIL